MRESVRILAWCPWLWGLHKWSPWITYILFFLSSSWFWVGIVKFRSPTRPVCDIRKGVFCRFRVLSGFCISFYRLSQPNDAPSFAHQWSTCDVEIIRNFRSIFSKEHHSLQCKHCHIFFYKSTIEKKWGDTSYLSTSQVISFSSIMRYWVINMVFFAT